MCFLSPETIKSTHPQDCRSRYAIVHGSGDRDTLGSSSHGFVDEP